MEQIDVAVIGGGTGRASRKTIWGWRSSAGVAAQPVVELLRGVGRDAARIARHLAAHLGRR